MFTNAPGTAATQGSTYTYQIQSRPSAGVTFTLTSAPVGATLSGNIITWTPTAAQSRVSNQFVVTATSPSASTTQSWSITPAGTINGTWIDTEWTPSGPITAPLDWTANSGDLNSFLTGTPVPNLPTALVPEADGSFKSIQGSGNSDGTFSIPNVPGGYYWLLPMPGLVAGSRPWMYWTSSSTIDLGEDQGTQGGSTIIPVVSGGPNTSIQVNYSGLDPLQAGDEVALSWRPFSLLSAANSPIGATTFSANLTTSADVSQPSPGFALQYEQEASGMLNALRLGPAELIPNLTLQNGTANTINATLTPSPEKSFDLNVKGSAWPALFNNAAPGQITLNQTSFALETVPFMAGNGIAPAVAPSLGFRLPLFAGTILQSGSISVPVQELPWLSPCGSTTVVPGQIFPFPTGGTITTDQDFGVVSYGDPFPSDWGRVFTLCQTSTAWIPLPGATSPVGFTLFDTQSNSVPTAQIAPPIGQVENPTIDGISLFQPETIASTAVNLSWTAPKGIAPTGYAISVFVGGMVQTSPQTSTPGYLRYFPSFLYTPKTSVVLPPLKSGQAYVFTITAILDGAANFETQPNRSALPTASVSVISAPITTQ